MKYLHWRKAMLVRRAARKLPQYSFSWAIIITHHADPDIPGWDYHLVRTEWGIGYARKMQAETGGWILTL